MQTDNPQYLLAIDNGTQSLRAMVFDQDGELVAKSKVDIEPYVSPAPGLAVQDAQYFWESLCLACQELWPQLNIPREAIKAVSVTAQRATVVPVDGEGQPLHQAISWLDQRSVQSKPALGAVHKLAFALCRASSTVQNFHSQAEANWFAQECPEMWDQMEKYLLLSGYHTHKLTGKFTDAVASQVGYLPFDFKRQQWAGPKDWKWRALPLRPDMLPTLRPAGGILGHITKAASASTGIPQGLPLIASGSDKACEVLGSGCVGAETGSMSYGTTATFNISTDSYLETNRFHPSYPGVVPGTYNPEMMVDRGFWMVSWFKNEFGLREQNLARELGVSPESLFDDLLRAVPPGSDGLLLQPYWSGASSNPGSEARGAIVGFSEIHTRAHIYRAIIEGIAYALREGKEALEKRSGKVIKQLRVSGGGSQSDQVMQITADIFGMPVERPHTFETSGLGAAIAAAVGVGIYPDFETATAKMTRIGASFEPTPKHHRTYDRLYREVYQKMYKRLRPGYQAIQSIAGHAS
ncbi:MAG: FGGY-family carbohydrate kinase [Proteobacteria bacterium]|nr:FGGY-family carbohydrate kinase [Pseudomonadota bacterium]